MSNDLLKLQKFDYTSILGWSISRYDKFNLCKRQYYYDYYSKYLDDEYRSKIEKLKKLTSVPLEVGNIVHDSIKVLLLRLLKTEKPIEVKKFFDYAKNKTYEYCSNKNFLEVYYKIIPALNIEEVVGIVKMSLQNFINSKRYNWIIKEAIENKKNWLIEPPGYGEVRINQLKAYCKVDFLFPVQNNIYILDWKTGKKDERKHKKQLLGYSLWASYHFEKEPENIFPIIIYLNPEYDEYEVKINEFDIHEFAVVIERETEEMYSFCVDVQKNIPKDIESFVKTKNLSICNFCNYQEICK